MQKLRMRSGEIQPCSLEYSHRNGSLRRTNRNWWCTLKTAVTSSLKELMTPMLCEELLPKELSLMSLLPRRLRLGRLWIQYCVRMEVGLGFRPLLKERIMPLNSTREAYKGILNGKVGCLKPLIAELLT